jgi:hypothetical protein
MDIETAREIVAAHEQAQRELVEAKEVIREAEAAARVRRQQPVDFAPSEEGALVAIALLEKLRDELTSEIAKLEGRQDAVAADRLYDLRRSLRQIKEGVPMNEGVDARIWAVVGRPEIQQFYFARPGLAAFRRELRRLRKEEEPIEEQVAEAQG